MNTFTEIDLEHWHRREQFRYYRTFENQLFNITLEFHAKKLYRFAKERGESFFARFTQFCARSTPRRRCACECSTTGGWSNSSISPH